MINQIDSMEMIKFSSGFDVAVAVAVMVEMIWTNVLVQESSQEKMITFQYVSVDDHSDDDNDLDKNSCAKKHSEKKMITFQSTIFGPTAL